MIKATHGALHVRANVRKLAKCCSVHFDARREFASRSGASVTMGASRLKALHKSFTRYRIGRNVTWELVVALSTIQRNRTQSERPWFHCDEIENAFANCRQAFGKVSLTSLLRRPLETG